MIIPPQEGAIATKPFATYLMMHCDDASYVQKLGHNKEFYFEFRDDPSFSNWETSNGGYMSSTAKPSMEEIRGYERAGYRLAKELIISADDEDVAENVMRLVYGGIVLVYPSFETPEPPFCYEITTENNEVFMNITSVNQ